MMAANSISSLLRLGWLFGVLALVVANTSTQNSTANKATAGSLCSRPKSHQTRSPENALAGRNAACKWYNSVSKWAKNQGLTGTAQDSEDGETWDRTVSRHVEEGKTDASDYLERYVPGCFGAPHPPGHPENDLGRFLLDSHALSVVDALANTDEQGGLEEATHHLNSLRLSSRNSSVRVLNSKGHYVALMITSVTPSTAKVASLVRKAIQNVDFFNEARLFVTLQVMGPFEVASSLGPLVDACALVRHVSFYFPPARSCYNSSVSARELLTKPEAYSKTARINIHWLWANNLVMNHAKERFSYVVTLEDDMALYPDFYLYHLSLQHLAVANTRINAISPIPMSLWYTCDSKDFVEHLKGNWSSSSSKIIPGASRGVTDMQALVVDGFVMPWGCGYTRRYVMSCGALYFGLSPAMVVKPSVSLISSQRYDQFGNSYAGESTGRLTLSPLSPRSSGDPHHRRAWMFGFPALHSCNHSAFTVVNPDYFSSNLTGTLISPAMRPYDEVKT
mmetsp:Transcript_86651/g.173368  ORF Transcript_86651/g.173368 Transcript_86651/m.173368 type:complete len:507 (+) Transcript_86651:143-1663(+)